MALGRVSGYPDRSSAGTGAITPQVWSRFLQSKMYATCVLSAIANTKREGEIKDYGDTVKIRTVPNITVSDYVKGQALTYQDPDSAAIELVINKGKTFSFKSDTVDMWQTDLNLFDIWANEGAQSIANAVDTDVLANLYASASTYNTVGTAADGLTAGIKSGNIAFGTAAAPLQITQNNVLQYIVQAQQALNEQNAPMTDRWMVIPATMQSAIELSSMQSASVMGSKPSIILNGNIGHTWGGFNIYMSNNLPTFTYNGATCFYVLFGHMSAVTFAAQITRAESMPDQRTFGQLYRGLTIYGYAVEQPLALGGMAAQITLAA